MIKVMKIEAFKRGVPNPRFNVRALIRMTNI
jgi:hypothetical protein